MGRQLSFVNTDNETIVNEIKRINALIEKFCEGIKPKKVSTLNGEKEIHVGMTTDKARQVVGNPSSISKSGGATARMKSGFIQEDIIWGLEFGEMRVIYIYILKMVS